jgi:ABC-2 type transport system permease protein
MTGTLLVAAREIRQTLRTRGFWVTLLSVPLVIAVSIAVSQMQRAQPAEAAGAYVVVDATGRYAPAIEQRLDREFGGEALAVPPPPDARAGTGPQGVARALAPFFQSPIATPAGPRRLVLAVYVPKDFAEGGEARVWSAGGPAEELARAVRDELTRALRRQALAAAGISADLAARIEATHAPVVVGPPPRPDAPKPVQARSILPLALVYLLLVTSLTTGSLMLQGLIEERSNKLLESVLACIRPGELMYGKLAGIGALGLLVVAVWAGCAAVAAVAAQGSLSELLRAALAGLADPWLLAWAGFYFLTGYLMIATVFLAVGSLSDSIQDAQGYLTPLMVLIAVPPSFIVQAALHDPAAALVRVLSWVPIYTPYAMLARLGAGVAWRELAASGALLTAFVALELFLLGRLFRASLLRSGQPPRLAAIARLMLREPES